MKYTFILQSKQRYGAIHTFFSDFFSSSTLLFELIGQCLMFTAFDCALQMNASAYNRTRIRTRLNIGTHTKNLSAFISIRRRWWRLYQKLRWFFSCSNFFSLFSCSFCDILLCNFWLINWNWQKRNVSLDLDQYCLENECFYTANGTTKKIGVSMCVYDVRMRVCVDFSFTIVNKSTIWHRLSFNLIWRFWLFIFSSCVNSTPV